MTPGAGSRPRPQLLVLSWWRAAGFRCRSGCENLPGNQEKGGEEAGAVWVLGAKPNPVSCMGP